MSEVAADDVSGGAGEPGPPSGARIPTASDPGPRRTTRNRRPTSATTRYFWPRVIVETSWTSIGTGRGKR